MALSNFTGPDYINDWTRDLDQRWPERGTISECVVETLLSWSMHSDRKKMHILELGIGSGGLSEAMLTTLDSDAVQSFIGIDINPELTRHTQARLRGTGHTHIRIENTDLKTLDWMEGLAPIDAAYTFQTLHDLGGQEALTAVYQQLFSLLTPGGLLVNADFVVPFSKDNPDKPRRFPAETHRALLTSLGFIEFKCEASMGKMACMSVVRP
jgi:predicted O-methyltransferase YrrM